jgi:hypothetical protein
MMTQQLGFSVLTAPIAAIDRRSLSQAWYSALHLAHESTQHAPPKAVCALETTVQQKTVELQERSCIHTRAAGPPPLHRSVKRTRTIATPVDRRSVRSPIARKIEHSFLRPNLTATRATFTIDGSSARVHVSMQQTRSGLRLVAVCPSRLRESVASALEQARYALAARGIAIDAEIAE